MQDRQRGTLKKEMACERAIRRLARGPCLLEKMPNRHCNPRTQAIQYISSLNSTTAKKSKCRNFWGEWWTMERARGAPLLREHHLGGTALNRLESSIECTNVLIYLLYINNRSNIFRTGTLVTSANTRNSFCLAEQKYQSDVIAVKPLKGPFTTKKKTEPSQIRKLPLFPFLFSLFKYSCPHP